MCIYLRNECEVSLLHGSKIGQSGAFNSLVVEDLLAGDNTLVVKIDSVVQSVSQVFTSLQPGRVGTDRKEKLDEDGKFVNR